MLNAANTVNSKMAYTQAAYSHALSSSAQTHYLLPSDKTIVAHWQPAILLNLMCNSLANEEAIALSNKLLKGTRLFYSDFSKTNLFISPEQFQRFIVNCNATPNQSDLAFRFGQRLLPGHYGDFSHGLNQVNSVFAAAELIQKCAHVFSPLLTPKVNVYATELTISFYSSYGCANSHRFVCEAFIFAIKNWLEQQLGRHLPWQFEFNYTAPEAIENYEVYLGDNLKFNRPVTAIRLPIEYAHSSWQVSENFTLPCAATPVSLLNLVRQLLRNNIQANPSLEWLAQQLDISPATLKRRLKACNTQFRDLLSEIRLEVAVELYQQQHFSSDAICQYLGFYDESNLRRFFKRTTGQTHTQYLALT